MLGEYAAYLRSLVDLSTARPLKVVVDAGNGMGGHTVPVVLDGLPLDAAAPLLCAGLSMYGSISRAGLKTGQ